MYLIYLICHVCGFIAQLVEHRERRPLTSHYKCLGVAVWRKLLFDALQQPSCNTTKTFVCVVPAISLEFTDLNFFLLFYKTKASN